MTDTYVVNSAGEKPTIKKDPEAVLDYTFDWTEWLDDVVDTISTRVASADAGIVVDSSAIVGKKVTIWLSGGTAGTTYRVECKITTVGGRTDERSIWIKVVER